MSRHSATAEPTQRVSTESVLPDARATECAHATLVLNWYTRRSMSHSDDAPQQAQANSEEGTRNTHAQRLRGSSTESRSSV